MATPAGPRPTIRRTDHEPNLAVRDDGRRRRRGDIGRLLRPRRWNCRRSRRRTSRRHALALGIRRLVLRSLLGLFGGEPRLLGRLGISLGFGLRILLRARGDKPHPLLFGLLRPL